MLSMRRPSQVCRIAVLSVFVALFFCEFLIYYITLYSCDYPLAPQLGGGRENDQLKAMILADTHLLGSRNGHWFDRLRREWQMHRAFQTAITYFKPDVVFFLGDLFDEGKWCPPEEFAAYVDRFHRLFAVDPADGSLRNTDGGAPIIPIGLDDLPADNVRRGLHERGEPRAGVA